MDINALLQMLHGGPAQLSSGGTDGAISAPASPQMMMPSVRMPQFAGAGGSGGVQASAQAAGQALSQPPAPSPSMGGFDPGQMGMFAMMQKMHDLQQAPTPTATFQMPDMRGNPTTQTISAPFPDVGNHGGLSAFLGRLFGG